MRTPTSPASRARPPSRWILLADDDPAIVEIWTMALTQEGYRVITAGTGRDTLELMRTTVPHLVVLDLRMPEMSGAEFLKVVLGAPALWTIPVLVVSGFLDEHVEALRRARFNVVGRLEKPVTPVQLVRAVETALATAVPPPARPGL